MRFEHDTRVGLERAFLSSYAQKQYRRTAHPAQKPKSKTQKGVGAPETAGADPNFKETRGMLPFDFSKCSDFCGVDLADYKPNLQMTKSCRYHPKICAGLASRNLLRFCHLRMITKRLCANPKMLCVNSVQRRFQISDYKFFRSDTAPYESRKHSVAEISQQITTGHEQITNMKGRNLRPLKCASEFC